MTEVRVRDVDDWIVTTLRQQAKAQGQTLEASVRELLRNEAMRRKQARVEELRAMQEELRQKYGTFSDSAALIREERERRG